MTAPGARSRADIGIGGITVGVRSSNEAFLQLLEDRYAGFIERSALPDYEFDVELIPPAEGSPGDVELILPAEGSADDVEPVPPAQGSPDDDVRVYRSNGRWQLERGDFRAEWDPAARRGRIRQSANPYSIDTVLRILHTLVLAREGGFLLHAASAVRKGKAYVFAGVSGAGKTTLSRLAPPDARVLSDEISYVRKEAGGYYAYGTPFAGELARVGENLRAPLATVYLLNQGTENGISGLGKADAARGILSNTLFFAADVELVQAVFLSALDLVEHVPVRRLTFLPEPGIWELIE